MKFDRKPNLGIKLGHHQYKLLLCLKKGMYEAQISRQLKTPRQTMHNRIKRLIDIGLIKIDVKTSCTLYKITRLGYISLSSYNAQLSRYLRGKDKTRMHRLNIKFKITDNNLKAKFDKNYKINNWIQSYTSIKFPIGITLKKTTKSIIVMFHEFETKKSRCLTEFFQHVMRGTTYAYYYLKKEHKITIDIFSGIVTDQHLINESPEFEKKIDKNKTTVMELARISKSVFPTEIKAKAWIDHSKGLPEIETNDFLYEEKLLMMPEYTEKIAQTFIPTMEELTKQIHLHLQVQKDTQVLMKGIGQSISEIAKYIKKQNKG